MRHYEIATVFHPDLEIDLDTAATKVDKIIESSGGKIAKKDNWGKRKLAYTINGQDWGIFVFYQVDLAPEQVASIERNLRITDEVMRYLIISLNNQKKIKKDSKKDPKKNQTPTAKKAKEVESEQKVESKA